jgi:hypothetical protein
MPVTFHPAPRNKVEAFARAKELSTPTSILKKVYSRGSSKPVVRHIQSSFACAATEPISAAPKQNGFVNTVMDAYNHHHALVIRPDDIWLAIVTQFSLFVNGEGRAEQLRYFFVAHEGKKKLSLDLPGGGFGEFAYLMTSKLHENVVDPELREWCLPDFSTTTTHDKVVASVVMMATLKAYFEYGCEFTCGIPRVTLLGTQGDWTNVYEPVGRLGRCGPETAAWRDLLKPVLARFVKAFEPGYAESAENLDFWQRVTDENHAGSGMDYLSGCITAFCAFNSQGRWQGDWVRMKRYQETVSALPLHFSGRALTIPGSFGGYWILDPAQYVFGEVRASLESEYNYEPKPGGGGYERRFHCDHIKTLSIDGVAYSKIGLDSIPLGVVEVDVVLYEGAQEINTVIVAGLVGTAASDYVPTNAEIVKGGEISPVAAWWIFEV